MKVVILLAEGFEEVEAITPIDFLRRAGIEVVILAVSDSLKVRGARGITVEADYLLKDYPKDADGIILPGGMPGAANIAASKLAADLTLDLYNKGKLISAICAAPAVVLAPLGILDGRKYTCYPGYEKDVKNGIFCEDRVVIDGPVVTSRAPGTAAEFALTLINVLLGSQESGKVFSATLQKG